MSIQALQAGDRIAAIRQNLTASVGKNDYSITVSYNSPKPDDILAEDKLIETYKIGVRPDQVMVVPVERVFQ